jgi:uncharacterized damage-inducible protein DinB
MPLNAALLPEFDHEMAGTRKTLERVPDGKLDWKPHAKSAALGGLATHLAQIPHWATVTIREPELDLAPPGAPPYRLLPKRSRDELLAALDANVSAARAAIADASDAVLLAPWSLLKGGHKIFTLPRIAALRSFVLSHTIHHRAQLGVYLRLLDIPVPSLYGPSADEGSM